MKRTIGKVLAAIVLSSGLAACAGLPGTGPAPKIYDLGLGAVDLDGEPRIRKSLVVEEPQATRVLDTDRIVIRPNGVEIQYLAESRWSDRAPRLMQTLLLQGFETAGRIRSVGRQAIGLKSDFALQGELWSFEADLTDSAKPIVTVRLSAKLVEQSTAEIKATKKVERSVEADTAKALDLVNAFQRAATEVVEETVNWTFEKMSD